jgi:hypothetical protein
LNVPQDRPRFSADACQCRLRHRPPTSCAAPATHQRTAQAGTRWWTTFGYSPYSSGSARRGTPASRRVVRGQNLLAANFDARASGRVLQHRPENLRHLTRRNLAALAAECGEAEAEKLWHEALLECPGDKLARARVGSANQVRLEPEMDAARASSGTDYQSVLHGKDCGTTCCSGLNPAGRWRTRSCQNVKRIGNPSLMETPAGQPVIQASA